MNHVICQNVWKNYSLKEKTRTWLNIYNAENVGQAVSMSTKGPAYF